VIAFSLHDEWRDNRCNVQAGVVSAMLSGGQIELGKRDINLLALEKLAYLGNSAAFYSVLVEVELFKPSPWRGGGLDGLHGSTV
jgi:hypothetical protein